MVPVREPVVRVWELEGLRVLRITRGQKVRVQQLDVHLWELTLRIGTQRAVHVREPVRAGSYGSVHLRELVVHVWELEGLLVLRIVLGPKVRVRQLEAHAWELEPLLATPTRQANTILLQRRLLSLHTTPRSGRSRNPPIVLKILSTCQS